MAERITLLRIEWPKRLAIEIRGPLRALRSAPTSARLEISPYDAETAVETHRGPIAYGPGVRVEPAFFEETDYEFTVELTDPEFDADKVELLTPGRTLRDPLRPFSKTGVLSCVLNVGSQAGYLDLELHHEGKRLVHLGLEVFPSKIDYRQDLVALRADLNQEVRCLAHDLYQFTYYQASRRRGIKPGEVEWLENVRFLFGDLQKAFLRIRQAPRTRIEVDEQIRRADQPTRHGATVRRYIQSHARQCVPSAVGHFQAGGVTYRARVLPVEKKVLTHNTIENQFVRWALTVLRQRVHGSLERLRAENSAEVKEQWGQLLQMVSRELRMDLDAVFLREVSGRLTTQVQSLALHMAPGYREFFRAFLDLLSSLEIRGGPFVLSEKELSTLYEMWCFIKLGSLLRRECGEVEKPNWLKVDRRGISVKLQKGVTSELVMRTRNRERIRLVYNAQEQTPTGNFRPDNMLEITKSGSRRAYHYIFDAKYRFADDPDYLKRFKAPGPPEDAINRMHAYRDQIVYQEGGSGGAAGTGLTVWDLGQRRYLQKSVMALVLYPNTDKAGDKNLFYASISKVGIGGLPFLPNETTRVQDVLRMLVEQTSDTEDDRAIQLATEDERERIKKSLEYGMMGIVSSDKQLAYIRQNRVYHLPYRELQGVRLRADFLVFFQSKKKFAAQAGVRYWAEVKNFHVTPRTAIKPVPPWEGRSDGLYAWFELGPVMECKTGLPPNETGHPQLFRVTTRLAFEEARTMDELSLVREPERRLYRELLAAGLKVKVREDRRSKQPVYDIGDLRLHIVAYDQPGCEAGIRFNPATGTYLVEGEKLFTFEGLMFEAVRCMECVRERIKSEP
jgi:hypothetical protein